MGDVEIRKVPYVEVHHWHDSSWRPPNTLCGGDAVAAVDIPRFRCGNIVGLRQPPCGLYLDKVEEILHC